MSKKITLVEVNQNDQMDNNRKKVDLVTQNKDIFVR